MSSLKAHCVDQTLEYLKNQTIWSVFVFLICVFDSPVWFVGGSPLLFHVEMIFLHTFNLKA